MSFRAWNIEDTIQYSLRRLNLRHLDGTRVEAEVVSAPPKAVSARASKWIWGKYIVEFRIDPAALLPHIIDSGSDPKEVNDFMASFIAEALDEKLQCLKNS